MRFYLLVALISGVVTFGLSWVVYKLSHRYRLYPKIRERDVHTRPCLLYTSPSPRDS